jgi:hypothetical protein
MIFQEDESSPARAIGTVTQKRVMRILGVGGLMEAIRA